MALEPIDFTYLLEWCVNLWDKHPWIMTLCVVVLLVMTWLAAKVARSDI
jgi:hypothetical protein